MMYAAKVDRNQKEIVAALRKIGATVELLFRVGGGVPDLLVGFRQRNWLIEVKESDGGLNEEQEDWHRAWSGQVSVVRSPREAIDLISPTKFVKLG